MAGNISTAASTNENSRALSGGRINPPGPGRADGSTGGHAGGGSLVARPRFDAPVTENGYRWWYIDALSDDGQNGLTIIGFVGSVFSPYYRRARLHSAAAPENHCAINVALYGSKRRWAMTERGKRHITRDENNFVVGPSAMRWHDDALHIDINERCMPLPFLLQGMVKIRPVHIYDAPIMLDDDGKHFWQAVSPLARIEVDFESPELSWRGNAYHDMNWGEEPLEKGFRKWTWLRAETERGTQVLYDVERQDGSRKSFGRIYKNGEIIMREVPQLHPLPKGLWGMGRRVNSEASPRMLKTLEDAPFYTRNHVEINLDGKPCEAYHESLSLDRFKNPLVQMMLPFRMPRVG